MHAVLAIEECHSVAALNLILFELQQSLLQVSLFDIPELHLLQLWTKLLSTFREKKTNG
jgi:hypothetical protein